MITSHTFRLVLATVAVLALAACGGAPETAAATDEGDAPAAVSMQESAFTPGTVQVASGASVRWTNNDDVPHTVTFSDDAVDSSEQLAAGDEFTATFAEAGTYDYVCTIHPDMTGTVTVR
jgi:plastocyanin